MLKVNEDFPLYPGSFEVIINRRNDVVNYRAIGPGLIQNVSRSEEIIMREKWLTTILFDIREMNSCRRRETCAL